jgi:hypothetical protein
MISRMDQAALAAKFPHAYFHPEARVLTWFPSGVLDNERADRVIEFLEGQESEGEPFHRYTDMSGYTRIQVELDHVVRLARRRIHSYQGLPIKSAFYAVRLTSVSIAKMYQELMQGSLIEVRTFRDRDAAADWLGVPGNLLARPKGT